MSRAARHSYGECLQGSSGPIVELVPSTPPTCQRVHISIADPLKLLLSAITYWYMFLLPINGAPTSFRRLRSIDVHLLLCSSYHPLD